MPVIAHVLLALVYTVPAIAIALTLPHSFPSVDRLTALVAGALVFLFGAILHEVAARQQRDRALARWLARLRSGDEELAAGLDQLHAELRSLRGAARPEPAPVPAPAPAPALDAGRDVSALVAELRTLRGMLARERAAAPALAEAEAPAEAAADAVLNAVLDAGPTAAGAVRAAPAAGAVTAAIRAALSGDRVDICIQPVVALPQRKHRFYQVTARLRLDDGLELGPEIYLPVARRDGLVAFIDNLLLFRAIQLLREAERRGQQVGFFCAVTADSLADRAFVRQFSQFMAHNAGLADKLMFELPQGELFDPDGDARPMLAELGRLGFRFVMGEVAHLDFDAPDLAARHVRYVKLDAGLILEQPSPFGGLDSVLALKHELERSAIDLIVDGIATEQQLVELLDLRLDFGQGALFGEPRPPQPSAPRRP
ncbi:EAL domain-containing protein [Arenibaculum sp.]|jgi:cyclic-di-GMP phosphodiesterase TipF (flagellum assembly factor)|uniref:EAL domain-containing protein n=1 Tax=Arenibaculum sp. TaxID=2865862 RepID=UPI002E0D54F5|nr:EAL domain-containing protein [Arenibaculum sp.]